MMTVQQLMISLICSLALSQSVLAMPLLRNEITSELRPYLYAQEMDKRDLEEVMIPDLPERLALFLQLPRTDRKQILEALYEDQDQVQDQHQLQEIAPESDFDSESEAEPIEIVHRSPNFELPVPMSLPVSPPSQKEVTGPIVVGPQTKSTQTSSAKKP